MTEVGKLSIKGSIDDTMIQRGFARIKRAFERVKSSAKSFGADMVRIGQATAQVGKSLGLIASVGLTAMLGLAKSAPAVAPAMAKIGVEFERLSRVLGQQLQPFFNKFAEGFTKFVSFVDAHPNITKGFFLSAATITGIVALTKLITALSGAVSPGMLTALGILGPAAGAAAVGYAGAKGAESLAGKTFSFLHREAEQIPGTLQSLASVDRSASEIAAEGFQPTAGGMLSAAKAEDIRRWILLRWWDAIWS